MKIIVIDGQGGGLGKNIIEKLKPGLDSSHEIIALGTNAFATSQMLRAGADEAATGENAMLVNVTKADIITGAAGIVVADSMMGELTAAMAVAIARSGALKVLIPLNRCGLIIAGVQSGKQISELIDEAVEIILRCIE